MLALVTLAVLMGINSANAALISEDFEGSTLGSTTPPDGWALNQVAGTSSYLTSTGANGLGLGGQITGNHPQNPSTMPAGYVVNSGSGALNTAKGISGSFDFWVEEEGNYSSGIFMFGDINSGIAQNDPGEFLGLFLREQTFGARASITDGAGAELATNNNNRINSNTWYTAMFSWTPTSGTTGDISISVNYSPTPWTETYSGFTFNKEEAYFAFGTGGYFSNEHTMRVDNIVINGTFIPEPTTATLGLVTLGALAMRRRRAA